MTFSRDSKFCLIVYPTLIALATLRWCDQDTVLTVRMVRHPDKYTVETRHVSSGLGHQFIATWHLDPAKMCTRTIGFIDVNTIQEQHMKMNRAAFGFKSSADPNRWINVTAPVRVVLWL